MENLFEISEPGNAANVKPITQLDSVKVIERGPVRAAIRFTRTVPDSSYRTIVQTVRLTARKARVSTL